LSYPHAVQGS